MDKLKLFKSSFKNKWMLLRARLKSYKYKGNKAEQSQP